MIIVNKPNHGQFVDLSHAFGAVDVKLVVYKMKTTFSSGVQSQTKNLQLHLR